MTTIERPGLPNFDAEMLEWDLEDYRDSADNPGSLVENPKQTNSGFSYGLQGAAVSDLLERREESSWYLRKAAQWGLALFQISQPDGRVQIRVGSRSVELPCVGPSRLSNPTNWMNALGIAWIVRDKEISRALTEISLDVPNAPRRGVERDEYLRAMTESLLALEADDPNLLTIARSARDLTKPEALQFLSPKMVEQIHGSPLDILLALASNDASQFEVAVQAALLGHRDYVVEDERTHQHDLLLPWLVLGLASKGYDRGWTVDIDSGYFPKWMVSGGLES